MTHVIPDISSTENKTAWFKLESAKRRLVYSLTEFQLPLHNRVEDPVNGLEFQLKGDPVNGPRVLTGHEDGVITLNIDEADDLEREKTSAFHARALPHAAGPFSP